MSEPSDATPTSRSWLLASALLFILVGMAAMASPVLFTIVIVRVLSYFVLASGVISLVLAVRGKQKGYRWLELLSGVIRIVAGIALLMCVKSSILVITLVFASYLVVEGAFVAAASLKLRPTPGWVWTLVNGCAAILLGILVFSRWPSSSLTVLGVFFGINLLCKGGAQLALGLAPKRGQS